MHIKRTAILAIAVGTVAAQRPTNTSICDYYTTALLKTITPENQQTLLTLIVNTAVIGNCKSQNHILVLKHLLIVRTVDTTPNVGVLVPGILAEGMINGERVNLLPYFNGGFASTNTGGMVGRSVNFLDGGGAAPLKQGKPANSTNARQLYGFQQLMTTVANRFSRLLTHLYQYFGALLGCTAQGGDKFPPYTGDASQYEVHKYVFRSFNFVC